MKQFQPMVNGNWFFGSSVMKMYLDLHLKLSPACLADFVWGFRYDSVAICITIMESKLDFFDITAEEEMIKKYIRIRNKNYFSSLL